MKHVIRLALVAALTALLVIGCAVKKHTPIAPFEVKPIPNGKYQQKVDYLYFIFDASLSMAEDDYGVKFDMAREVVRSFNKTMPDVNVKVGMRSFGHDEKVSKKNSVLVVKPKTYIPELLNGGLTKVFKAGGCSPLETAMNDAVKDLKKVKGPIAMVIVSDGKEISNESIASAKALKADHNNICIYTVQTGTDMGGTKLLKKIAQVAGCGKAVKAKELRSGAAMNAFVKEVLLVDAADSDGDGVMDSKDRCPNTPRGVKVDKYGCPLDSDGDGVYDYKDLCPGTPKGVKVDAKGCPLPLTTKSAEVTKKGTWIYKDIQFELNKSDLRSSSYPVLNDIVTALKAQPNLKIEIQGHTDSTGAHGYNMTLSEKRAQSVKAYLIAKGIANSRLTTKGYGPDMPIDSNATKDGRARNRRVEIKPLR